MVYLDTSLLVAAFTQESETGRVLAWLKSSQSNRFAISEWVATEFSAALSVKIRTKQIDERYRASARALFAKTVANSMDVITITSAHFQAAARLADRNSLGLRAGDALHLAIAADRGATLCTLDRQFAKAGKALGAAMRLL